MSRSLPACLLFLCMGCASPFDPIDLTLARQARSALRQERPPQFDERDENEPPEEEPRHKSVVIAELLAIFPGMLWHGLGHYYAGDTITARRIHRAGEWGYLLTALGGGLVLGGYFLDKETDDVPGLVISLYSAGGVTGAFGSGFFLTAWFYDMIDTPRAARSGGQPPPRDSLFGKDLEDIGDD